MQTRMRADYGNKIQRCVPDMALKTYCNTYLSIKVKEYKYFSSLSKSFVQMIRDGVGDDCRPQ